MYIYAMYRIFLNIAKNCMLYCLSKFYNKKNFHRALRAKIKGVFSRSWCCYGNLLCHENTNVFTTDWAVDTMIVASIDKEWLL